MATLIMLSIQSASPSIIAAQSAAAADVIAYHTLIDRYASGDDAAAREILKWDHDSMRSVQRSIERRDDPRYWDIERFQCAAMLHTDGALSLVRMDSDETQFIEQVLFHLDVAGGLLRLASARWDVRAFSSAWYVAVERVVRDRNWLTTAERYLDRGRDRLPGDPAVLYESAIVAELLATSTQLPQSLGRDGERRVDTSWSASTFERLRQRRIEYLNRAARWLRQSLQNAPEQAEARLRLGRVEMLRGANDQAERELQVAARASSPPLAYLAFLFQGALQERRGNTREALEAYRRAHEIMPTGQAATVALAEVSYRHGRGAEAASLVSSLLVARPAVPDPWGHYFFEAAGAADRRLESVRRGARR